MNRVLSFSVAAGLGLALTSTPSAGAAVVASYCSPSGDYCTAVTKTHGRVKLEIQTFSFDSYRLCVKGAGDKKCIPARLDGGEDGLMGDRIDAARRFFGAPGQYKASWRFEGTQLGPSLSYRIR